VADGSQLTYDYIPGGVRGKPPSDNRRSQVNRQAARDAKEDKFKIID
jgi:hypothetical protein